MDATTPGIRRLCVAIDLKRDNSWSTPQQVAALQCFDQVLTAMWERAGINRRLDQRLPLENGEFMLLHPGVDEPAVVAGLIMCAHQMVAEANVKQQELVSGVRLRVRMALHEGVSHDAQLGPAGQVVTALRRMLDSALLRQALADPGHVFAVAVSDQVFQDSVAQRYQGLDPEAFYPARLEDAAHDFVMDAWIHAPAEHGYAEQTPTDTAEPGAFDVIQGLPPFAAPPIPGADR